MRVSLGRTNNKKQPSPPPLFVSTSRGPAGVPLKPCVSLVRFSFFFLLFFFPFPCLSLVAIVSISSRHVKAAICIPPVGHIWANAVQRYFVLGDGSRR